MPSVTQKIVYRWHCVLYSEYERYIYIFGTTNHTKRGFVLFQCPKIKEQTTALFAGGELSEEDQAAFIKEMEALFLDAKADAKKFTPKKYLR